MFSLSYKNPLFWRGKSWGKKWRKSAKKMWKLWNDFALQLLPFSWGRKKTNKQKTHKHFSDRPCGTIVPGTNPHPSQGQTGQNGDFTVEFNRERPVCPRDGSHFVPGRGPVCPRDGFVFVPDTVPPKMFMFIWPMFARHFLRKFLLFLWGDPSKTLAAPQPLNSAFPLGNGGVLRSEEGGGIQEGRGRWGGEKKKEKRTRKKCSVICFFFPCPI